jgi:hypothetical protein
MRTGHGHVTPREDGMRARCGGPVICSVCAKELAIKLMCEKFDAAAKQPMVDERPRDGEFSA